MQRLIARWRDEDGAVAIIVAASIVVLVGMAAWVVDAGALYQERRELQNGADAAALAIAEDCAQGLLLKCTPLEADDTAEEYLDGNAVDEVSALDDVDLDLTDKQVYVQTSTETGSGGTAIPFKFAQVLGFTSQTVRAAATAAWGPPGGMSALPLTLGECEFDTHPIDVPGTVIFHGDDGTGCPSKTSGAVLPGNFGWLTKPTDGSCKSYIENGVADGDTGNNPECTEAQLDALLGKEVAIPIFTEYDGQGGTKVDFTISGFAIFELWGYRFPSMDGFVAPLTAVPCEAPDTCIGGVFRKFVGVGDVDSTAIDYGAVVVELIPNPEETS